MGEEWYTNKQLFEMFTTVVNDLKDELKETKDLIKTYNGLREVVNNVSLKQETLEESLNAIIITKRTIDSIKEKARINKKEYIGYIIAIITIFISLIKSL